MRLVWDVMLDYDKDFISQLREGNVRFGCVVAHGGSEQVRAEDFDHYLGEAALARGGAVVFEGDENRSGGSGGLGVYDIADGFAHSAEGDVRDEGVAVGDFGFGEVVVIVPGVDLDAAGASVEGGGVGAGRGGAVELVGEEVGVVAGGDEVFGEGVGWVGY